MGLTLPYPNDPQNGTTGDATKLAANFAAISNAIQQFDAAQIANGTLIAPAFATAINPITRTAETSANFVYAGGVVSNTTGLTITVTGGTFYINGNRVVFPGVASKVLSANQDTYIDVDNNSNVTYVAVANGATTGMTLTTNSIRIAKVVTNASAVSSISQGGYDPLLNPIYPKSVIPFSGNSFSNSVQSYTNTGNGAGTFNYINIGGLKLLWGQFTAGTTSNNGLLNFILNYPPNLFSTIPQVFPVVNYPTNTSQWVVYTTNLTTSASQIGAQLNATGTATIAPAMFVIGV